MVRIGSKDGQAVPSANYAELTLAQRLLVAAYVAVGVWYLAWRPASFNPDAWLFSAVVYGAEAFGFACAMLYLVMCWRLRRRAALPVPPNATVAVLVPTIDESVDIVRRTLMAAQRMKHAHEVWLLDDGNRLEMHVLAEELGCRYLARLNNRHAKAGNLNNALKHTRAAYIAIFDADHAPAPTFLEETLGFFCDEKVAFVQTPQDFYNLDSFQHRLDRDGSLVWSEQSLFFRVIQAGKDNLNAAFFCGSCAVIRRKALDDIDGFATGSVTTDIHTSLKLHKRGWSSVYYAKSLAFGLAPVSAVPFLRQRLRAGIGAMQAWREEAILFGRGLSPGQRISYLATMLAHLEGWQSAVFLLVPLIVLTTGVLPIAAPDAEFFARLMCYYLLAFWALKEVARGYGRTLLAAQYRILRFAVSISATFGLLRREMGVVCTPKRTVARDAFRPSLWPQYLVMGLNAAAIPAGLALFRNDGGLPLGALVASLLWASMTLGVAGASLRFARRVSATRRREYRFPLPVPLQIKSGKEPLIGLATDISPMGCRVVGAPVACARGGDELRGDLLLPTGPLPVTLSVRTVLVDGNKAAQSALGCEFRWGLSDERNQLELFLFGSDLQWRLNGFEDRVRTPLERLRDRLGGVSPAPRRLAGQRWSPVLYRRVNANHEGGVGFISVAVRGGEERTLVSLGELPANGRLYAEEVTAAGPRGVVGRVADGEVLETHAAPIYLYKLTG